jgi:hypothetical protein
VVALATLLLTSTIPVIFLYPAFNGCELNPALCLVYFLILEFGFTDCSSERQCVVPFISVSKLKKEQHRQRSQKHTQEYPVCIPIERFLSGDCYSLKRTRLKGLTARRTHCRIAKAKVMTTSASCETHI